MYRLSDKQIDFILDDIRARGVEMEDLQMDLLDHVCCVMENEMEQNEDFETFYKSTIRKFYKNQLWEIEEETIQLLMFKNYYTMKKIMILSGLFSVFTMIIGIWFKLMHYPGAAVVLPFGIMCGSFVFMPLLFTLKAKEKQTNKDKMVVLTGGLSILLIGLCFIVRLVGGPSFNSVSMNLFYLSAAIALLVFIPIYLSAGLRNPETKINCMVTAVVVLMGYTVLFSMIYNRRAEPMYRTLQTYDYLRSQQILITERLLAEHSKSPADISNPKTGQLIDEACERLKAAILQEETGFKTIDEDFQSKNILLSDHGIYLPKINSGINELRKLVPEYNATIPGSKNKIPLMTTFLHEEKDKVEFVSIISLLNQITQVQMLVFQNERKIVASK